MSHDHPSRKLLKRWFTFKRNKRDRVIHQHLEHMQQDQARVAALQEQMAPERGEESGKDPIWSARTQEIRNRMTDKKRDAKDRWNRFAGTSDAGGRGL